MIDAAHDLSQRIQQTPLFPGTLTQQKLTTSAALAVFTRKHPLELVIFCGSPGSGKSTYFWKHLEPLGYERVNQDILKSVSTASTTVDPPSDE